MPDTTSRIRELNDQLRCQHRGGTIVVTVGIQSMGADFIAAVDVAMTKVTFDSGNDPYGEHDFGVVEVKGRRIFFKIDYYDLDLCFVSPDPANQKITRRVMTIMLAEEY
jgi:Protein of unknown function (DUF3768)